MPDRTFIERAQSRSQRIKEEVWEYHKDDLMREFVEGGQSIACVLDWIHTERLVNFRPTYVQLSNQVQPANLISRKQLEHRIKKVWGTQAEMSKKHTTESAATNLKDRKLPSDKRKASPCLSEDNDKVEGKKLKTAKSSTQSNSQMEIPRPELRYLKKSNSSKESICSGASTKDSSTQGVETLHHR